MEPNGLSPGEKTVISFVPSDSVAARLEGREMQRFCRIFFWGVGVMISSDSDRAQRSLQAIRAVRVGQTPEHTFR